MEPIFLSVDSGDGEMRIYPLSAFGYLTHNSRGHLHIAIGDRLWPLADCRSEEMAIALEDAILQEIAATIQEHRRLRNHQGPPALILDLNEIAYSNQVELRLEEDEVARADALLARDYHAGEECHGGGA